MIYMGETYASKGDTESLVKGRNTSHDSKSSTYKPTRTVEKAEEEAKIEAILSNARLMGTFGIIGIPKKDLAKLSKSSDPFRGWASRYAWMLGKEEDDETIY
jgi:3-methyladenine DNA glycosylase/8-oxoguanine DNA glycosylase